MKITAFQVIHNAELHTGQAQRRLAEDENMLHVNGYNQWSAAMGNLRTKIEEAFHEFVEEVDPES